MAISVMNWVLEEAPDLPAHCFGVLMALASKAREDGTAAYAGQPWLAIRTRKTTRQVRSDLAKLEELKLIRRGDQSIAAHIPADERPVVWDLAIERVGGLRERKQTSARKRTSAGNYDAVKPNTQGSDQHEQKRERKPTSARNSTAARKPTSGGERKPASAYTSFDKSSSSPSEKSSYGRGREKAPSTLLGNTLLDEHLKAVGVSVPRDVKQQTGDAIDRLVAEGIEPDRIRAGLALMRSSRGKGPGLLAYLVHDADLAATAGDSRSRYSPQSGSRIPTGIKYSTDPKDVFGP